MKQLSVNDGSLRPTTGEGLPAKVHSLQRNETHDIHLGSFELLSPKQEEYLRESVPDTLAL